MALDDLTLDGMIRGMTTEPANVSVAAPALRADLEASRLAAPAEFDLRALGVSANVAVRSLSWAEPLTAEATLSVQPFALPDLLALLAIEAPATADPGALQRVAFSSDAALGADTLGLRELTLTLDDTTLNGRVTVPMAGDAPIEFDLAADRIKLDRYMAPASDAETAADDAAVDDFEIPVELIRGVNARGNLRLAEAELAGMTFTNMELGLNAGDGKLRLNPLSAELFDGSYSGDIRVDASAATPTLALNERITDVSLTPLVQAMFERDNVTGTVDGSFVLDTRGETLSAMRQNLNGNMTFELADGAWQGVDLWHQLRTARALYRRETPPEPQTPARTAFTSVLATGTVTDGVFRNDDLMAEMPFLQLSGSGTADLVAGTVDYSLRARVLERPEFLDDASEDEIDEFTEALIPVRVTGPLNDPSVRPDIEAMFRDEVEEALQEKGDELKQRLLDRLLPGQSRPADGETATSEEEAAADEEEDVEEQLKNRLKNLFEQSDPCHPVSLPGGASWPPRCCFAARPPCRPRTCDPCPSTMPTTATTWNRSPGSTRAAPISTAC
ncbi:MAG: AsmA family protein [Woeseiaceae bacterium]|nr:AsmA family protein [Woeseiaceae bacterium]